MFTRKTVEQMVTRMIQWGRGASKNLSDFRPGSKIRTLYEAVALIIEDFYDKLYRAMKLLIAENIYAIFSFDKIASVHATGNIVFSRSTVADTDYLITAGTLIQSLPTDGKQAMNYRTTGDVVLLMGTTEVTARIVCEMAGELGNAGAHTITNMVMPITGVEQVTNPTALTNGAEEETKESQKTRFQRFIQANARAVLPSIEYGATLATITDVNGVVVERVVQAKAFEELPDRLGEVDVYIWNGIDGASEDLLAEAAKHITGYYDENGQRVYGYKAAGIWLNMYVVNSTEVYARLDITTENWFTPSEARILAEREIDNFFADLVMGETVVQTALETNIKNISGIYDVKLYFSTDEMTSYNTANISTDERSIARIQKPLLMNITSRPYVSFEDPPLRPLRRTDTELEE